MRKELTRIEKVTLSLIMNGWKYRVVGEWLGVTEDVIKARVDSARKRTGIRTTKQLLQRAERRGWLNDLD